MIELVTNEKTKLSDKVWEILVKVMVPVGIIAAGTIIGHEIRLTRIESNRFTDHDAGELRKDIMQALPPQWLRDEIRENKEWRLKMQADMARVLAEFQAHKENHK